MKYYSITDGRRILSKDLYDNIEGKKIAAKRDVFDANAQLVAIACNCWFAYMVDCGINDDSITTIKYAILDSGLIPIVNAATSLAEGVMEGLGQLQELAPGQFGNWMKSSFCDRTYRGMFAYICDEITSREWQRYEDCIATLLQVLLFLERFSYDFEELAGNSLAKFQSVNQGCKQFLYDNSIWPSWYICQYVQMEFADIFNFMGHPVGLEVLPDNCAFSHGSCADSSNLLLDKLKVLISSVPCYKECMYYPLPGGENMRPRTLPYPKLLAVPKAMLSRRIIAPESVVNGYYAQSALWSLRSLLHVNGVDNFINEEEQAVNRFLAEQGSSTGEWATIDMSSASDSISRYVVRELISQELWDSIEPFMSRYVVDTRGVVRNLHMLFTSGNPLTWLFEACYFLAIGRAGVRLCGFDPEHLVYAYGDDLIVPSECYETVCDLLEAFGHTVNRRKSYGYGVFRESCGGWYCNGVDVTPSFWSRGTKPDQFDTYHALIHLQHIAAQREYSELDKFCRNQLKRIVPDVTTSEIGSIYDDIWDKGTDAFSSSRRQHTCVKEIANSKQLKQSDRELLTHYYYYRYLELGPMYTSEFDRLLGISTPRRDMKDYSICEKVFAVR